MYFKKQGDQKEAGACELPPGAVVDLAEEADEGADPQAPCVFFVAPTGDPGAKVVWLKARDQAHLSVWMDTVDELLRRKETKVNPRSIREGYLFGSFSEKKISQRYFCVLLDDSFQFYKKRGDPKAAGEVVLQGGSIIEQLNEHTLMIASSEDESEKMFYLKANRMQNSIPWFKDIRELLTQKDSKVNKESLYEGYLLGASKLNATSHQRYFILSQDRLQYFKHRDDSKPEGEVLLPGGAHCELEAAAGTTTFSVAPTGDESEKYYYCTAKNPKAAATWVGQITAVLKTKDSQKDSASILECYAHAGYKAPPAAYNKWYVVLLEDKLQYFKSRNDANPAGEVLLPLGFAFDVEEEKYASDGLPRCMWVLASGDVNNKNAKRFFMVFPTGEKMAAWMVTFSKLVVSKASRKLKDSAREGFLLSTHKKGVPSKRRFFVLNKDTMTWYALRIDDKPEASMPINGGCMVDYNPFLAPNDICVRSCDDDGANTLFLTCANNNEAVEWLGTLSDVVAKQDPGIYKDAMIEGYLFSKGRGKGRKKKYVVLTAEKLFIYNSKMDAKPKMEFNVNQEWKFSMDQASIDNTVNTVTTVAMKIVEMKLEVMEAHKLVKSLVLVVPTAESVKWITALQTAIKGRPKLFGGDLAGGIERSYIPGCPAIVHECMNYLLAHGTDTVGIFRVPGNNEEIGRLKAMYENQRDGPPIALNDVNNTAGILKLYFRSLTDPPVPMTLYNNFISIDDGGVDPTPDKVRKLKAALSLLPEVNYRIIHKLVTFLAAIASHAEENKMTTANCAMVFAPGFLKSPESMQEATSLAAVQTLAAEIARSQNILQLLIEARDQCFDQQFAAANLALIKCGTCGNEILLDAINLHVCSGE